MWLKNKINVFILYCQHKNKIKIYNLSTTIFSHFKFLTLFYLKMNY